MHMKTNFIFRILAVAALCVALAACSKTPKEAPPAAEAPSTATDPADTTGSATSLPQFDVDNAFRTQLSAVFNAYLAVKDALVASDVAQVKSKTPELNHALQQVDMKLLSGAAHNDWMTYQPAMETSIKGIESTTDIEAQRKQFHALSENLYKSIKAYGLSGATAYYEYCPMAFNNAGATWLSNTTQIKNPYFGSAMLTCGSVKETLK